MEKIDKQKRLWQVLHQFAGHYQCDEKLALADDFKNVVLNLRDALEAVTVNLGFVVSELGYAYKDGEEAETFVKAVNDLTGMNAKCKRFGQDPDDAAITFEGEATLKTLARNGIKFPGCTPYLTVFEGSKPPIAGVPVLGR